MANINIENFWDDKKRTADALEEIAGIEKNATNIRYDDDKRIARAVEKIQKEGGIPSGGGSQADWNENDSTSPAYILNKPFGIPTQEVILENGTVNITYDDEYEEYNVSSISIETPLMAGETYIFTIDGVDYTSTGVAAKPSDYVKFENIIVVGTSITYDKGLLQFPCFYGASEVGTHTVKIRHISYTKIDANMYVSNRNYGTSESGKLLVINDQGIPSPKPITEYNLSIIYSSGSGYISKKYNEIFDAYMNGKSMTAFVNSSNSNNYYLLPLAYANGITGASYEDNAEFVFQAATYAIDQNSITSTTVRQLIINSSGATYSEATS